MILRLLSLIYTFSLNAQASSAPPTKPTNGLDVDALRTIAGAHIDWKSYAMNWLTTSPWGITGLSLGVIFGFLFVRRWRTPRNGMFLFTSVVILTRTLYPQIIFWQVLAPAGALLALGIFFYVFSKKQLFALKEPTYFLFNFFSLVCMSLPVSIFTIVLAMIGMSLSLFFLISRANQPPEKYKGTDADHNILDSLEKRAARKL